MDRIREVTEEFYGSSSSKKPFNSLEELKFEDMPEWKQWQVLGNGEFPTLERLMIKNCPELSNSLTSLLFSVLPSTLKRVRIYGCQKLKLEAPVGEMFLEELEVEACDCIDDISLELLPKARFLKVERCPSLTRVLITTATEILLIGNCDNVERLSVSCGNLPFAVTGLFIQDCSNLKWLPEHMQELLPSLEHLILSNCPEIESFPQGGLPFNLQVLSILNCTKLLNGRKEWRLPCLKELWIEHDGSDEEIHGWELPSSIQQLQVSKLKTLTAQLLKSLNPLEYLSHLTSLQSLCIQGYPNLQFLSESALPSFLSKLTIMDCPNLQSISESALPSSLSELAIMDCPNLQSLPLNGMLSSLSTLYINNCPLLTPLLEFDNGEYWPNIAHIPSIIINRRWL